MNFSEVLTGLIFGLAWVGYVGWHVLWLAPLCSLLWALGGSVNKIWRRVGATSAVVIFLTVTTTKLWVLCFAFGLFAVLSIGYGIPSTQPPDKGSWLGRFFFNYFHQNETLADLMTRWTIAVLVALCFSPLLALEPWWKYLVAFTILTAGFPLANHLGKNK